ncbi:MAG: FAD-dependent oxidoreductase [Pseudonocardiaceae bacterium]|nr:FAD-dependent oxidoreductase [Pseudonocardiaceae bacterium]
MRVLVVGAGVVGLSCAVRLREAGVAADVVADAAGAATTSAAAAALWYPYRAHPPERVTGWAASTREELERLSADATTGVVLRDGVEYVRQPTGEPWWASAVPRLAWRGGGPAGCAGGWAFRAPVADTGRYLDWLAARLGDLGGSLRHERMRSVAQARAEADAVVLATGVGARELPGDPAVTPVRGQVVRVRAPSVRQWVLDEGHPAGLVYVVPRIDDVVCGGVDEPGAESPEVDAQTARRILARCIDVVPELAGAQVTGHAVGLRPYRPSVRLERDPSDPGVVHCYGHGGAGVTLSWGCADEVTDLITGR